MLIRSQLLTLYKEVNFEEFKSILTHFVWGKSQFSVVRVFQEKNTTIFVLCSSFIETNV